MVARLYLASVCQSFDLTLVVLRIESFLPLLDRLRSVAAEQKITLTSAETNCSEDIDLLTQPLV